MNESRIALKKKKEATVDEIIWKKALPLSASISLLNSIFSYFVISIFLYFYTMRFSLVWYKIKSMEHSGKISLTSLAC